MKTKSDGKQMLRFWLGLSELLVWLTIYQLLKYTGFVGAFVCVVMVLFKWYELFAEKRDVYHRYKKNRKATVSIMLFVTITVVMLDVGNLSKSFYTLMLFFGYYLTNTYAINIYNWVVRWGDMSNADQKLLPNVYFQLDSKPEMLEAENRKFLGRRFMPVLFMGSVLCYGIWISPIFNWLRGKLMFVFSNVMLVIANTVLSIYPDMRYTDPSGTQGGPVAPEFKALEEMKKMTAGNNFDTSYQIVAILMIGLTIAAIAFYGYRAWRRSSNASLRGDYKSGKGKMGVMDTLRTVTAEIMGQSKSSRRKGIPEEVLRRKYIQLLKHLENHGWTVEKTDTSDQIKHKLSQLYPNQETVIEVITDAYCERRYAERDPENIDMVLQAFSTLERIKQTDSPAKGGVS